ncbi:MAG: ankyrin repeat domain-containing protein, partial [Pseudomonadota bacterium]
FNSQAKEIPYIDLGDNLVTGVDRNDTHNVQSILLKGEHSDSRGKFGITGLMRAAIRNNAAMAELLIKNGADVNSSDYGGATPLHLATRFNSQKVIGLLLEAEASVTIADNDGWTPLMLALKQKQYQLVKLYSQKLYDKNHLIKHKNFEGQSTVSLALSTNSLEIIKQVLLQLKPEDLNKELVLYSSQRNPEITKWLDDYFTNNLKSTKQMQQQKLKQDDEFLPKIRFKQK